MQSIDQPVAKMDTNYHRHDKPVRQLQVPLTALRQKTSEKEHHKDAVKCLYEVVLCT